MFQRYLPLIGLWILYFEIGGESRDLNDRVHGNSCRYSDKKQVNKLITLFLTPNRFSYLLIIQSKRSSQSYSTMCRSFPHKSEQILFSVFRLCSNFCGKLLHIVEKHLDEWLPGIMRRYVHFIA